MIIDPENTIVKLCARGMALEGEPEKAAALFLEAWEKAVTDVEKCMAAHYMARHQESVSEKLIWDNKSLQHALLSKEEEDIQEFYPSLYLNIAKCHEDLQSWDEALVHYQLAEKYAQKSSEDGYQNFILQGISKGIERVKEKMSAE